ncbi:hypothetical protein ACOSQ3_032825 [Xanthoceras sorbifolium]
MSEAFTFNAQPELMATEEEFGKTQEGCASSKRARACDDNASSISINGGQSSEKSRGVNIGRIQKNNDKDSNIGKEGQHQRLSEVNVSRNKASDYGKQRNSGQGTGKSPAQCSNSSVRKNGGSRFDVLVDEDSEDADIIGSKTQSKEEGKDVNIGHTVLTEISNTLDKGAKIGNSFKIPNCLRRKPLAKGKQNRATVSDAPSSSNGRGTLLRG